MSNISKAKIFKTEFGNSVKGYESTWNHGVVYFVDVNTENSNSFSVYAGKLDGGVIKESYEISDDLFYNQEEAFDYAHGKAMNKDYYHIGGGIQFESDDNNDESEINIKSAILVKGHPEVTVGIDNSDNVVVFFSKNYEKGVNKGDYKVLSNDKEAFYLLGYANPLSHEEKEDYDKYIHEVKEFIKNESDEIDDEDEFKRGGEAGKKDKYKEYLRILFKDYSLGVEKVDNETYRIKIIPTTDIDELTEIIDEMEDLRLESLKGVDYKSPYIFRYHETKKEDGNQYVYVKLDEVYADGGGVEKNDRMYNFLKDDLERLEQAIKNNDNEEVDRFFSYWSYHLTSLKTKENDRMYNFLKDDLEKLEQAIKNNDNDEIDRFFSYWSYHLASLVKFADGGGVDGVKYFYVKGRNEDAPKSLQDTYSHFDSEKELTDYLKKWKDVPNVSFSNVTKVYSDGKSEDVSGFYLEDSFAKGGSVGEKYEVELHWKGLDKNRTIGKYVVSEKTLNELEEQWSHIVSVDVYDNTDKKPISWYELKKELYSKGRDIGLYANGGGVGIINEKDFITKKQFKKGNTLIKLEKLSNPTYYRVNYIDLIDNEVSSYGSPYFEDVIFDINQTKYSDGGGVGNRFINNYEDKTESEIWNNIWTRDQKYHFLHDHADQIGFDEEFYNQIPKSTKRIQGSNGNEIGFRFINPDELVQMKSYDLPRYVKFHLQQHIREGQYSNGGGVSKRILVVLDEGNGKVINDLFNEWNNIKSEKEYSNWTKKIKSTNFGTYGTISINEVLEKFEFDKSPINDILKRSFKKELNNALNSYSDGGGVEVSKSGSLEDNNHITYEISVHEINPHFNHKLIGTIEKYDDNEYWATYVNELYDDVEQEEETFSNFLDAEKWVLGKLNNEKEYYIENYSEYSNGGGVGEMFYIHEGYDHKNSKPIFRVESTSDSEYEYIGDWHEDENDAKDELKSLNSTTKRVNSKEHLISVLKDAISTYIQEKYNENVDWDNSFLKSTYKDGEFKFDNSDVSTFEGNDYHVTPNDLVNKSYAGGGSIKLDVTNKKTKGSMVKGTNFENGLFIWINKLNNTYKQEYKYGVYNASDGQKIVLFKTLEDAENFYENSISRLEKSSRISKSYSNKSFAGGGFIKYVRPAYDVKISGKYKFVTKSKTYELEVAGFEREGDDSDLLYLTDSDPMKSKFGGVIVKNNVLKRMSKGITVGAITSKTKEKGKLTRIGDLF